MLKQWSYLDRPPITPAEARSLDPLTLRFAIGVLRGMLESGASQSEHRLAHDEALMETLDLLAYALEVCEEFPP